MDKKEKEEEKVKDIKCPRCNSKFGYATKDGIRICRNCSNKYKIKW